VYSVLLHPLPYANGDRILTLSERIGVTQGYNAVTLGNFDTWRKEARSFDALGAEWGLDRARSPASAIPRRSTPCSAHQDSGKPSSFRPFSAAISRRATNS
jgi:hypothetical protein